MYVRSVLANRVMTGYDSWFEDLHQGEVRQVANCVLRKVMYRLGRNALRTGMWSGRRLVMMQIVMNGHRAGVCPHYV